MASSSEPLQPVGHLLPVDQIPPVLHELGAPVTVIDIIGVFPNVDRQQRFQSPRHRVAGVGFRHDHQLAVGLLCEPCPARTEQPYGRLREGLPKDFDRAEVARQRRRQFFGHRLLVGRQREEEEGMVPSLRGVVEDASVGLADDFVERHLGIGRPLDQLVEIVDVGLEMFAIVVLEGLRAHLRRERFRFIGKLRQRVFHSLSVFTV